MCSKTAVVHESPPPSPIAEGQTRVSKRTVRATPEHNPAPLCRLSLRLDTDSWVYQAAQYEGVIPPICVAVEDSASGVGSAFAAEMGLIVGYVGASHISEVSVCPLRSSRFMKQPARDTHILFGGTGESVWEV